MKARINRYIRHRLKNGELDVIPLGAKVSFKIDDISRIALQVTIDWHGQKLEVLYTDLMAVEPETLEEIEYLHELSKFVESKESFLFLEFPSFYPNVYLPGEGKRGKGINFGQFVKRSVFRQMIKNMALDAGINTYVAVHDGPRYILLKAGQDRNTMVGEYTNVDILVQAYLKEVGA